MTDLDPSQMTVLDLVPLCWLLHGDWGAGKSWLASTAPAPRLVFDCEFRADMTFGRKVWWENTASPPPEWDGTWDTCIVRVRDTRTVREAVKWLKAGRHPFVSVIFDSLSEYQKRIVDEVLGSSDKMDWEDFGVLFRKGEGLVREIRDLKWNPVKPMICSVFIAGSVERGQKEENIRLQPYVQGQLSKTLGGFPDIEGMLVKERDASGQKVWLLKVDGVDGIQAKDATHTFLDGEMDVTYDEGVGWRNTIASMQMAVTLNLRNRSQQQA